MFTKIMVLMEKHTMHNGATIEGIKKLIKSA